MAPHSSTFLENPMVGGAWQAAVHRVAKSQTRLNDFTFTFMHWSRKWQPTSVFLPGESQGRGAWWSDTTEATQQQQSSAVDIKELKGGLETYIILDLLMVFVTGTLRINFCYARASKSPHPVPSTCIPLSIEILRLIFLLKPQ